VPPRASPETGRDANVRGYIRSDTPPLRHERVSHPNRIDPHQVQTG